MNTGKESLRVLLSAYACEPGKGSEPGVGWNWALALARRGHEVWVLTRANNRDAIDLAVSEDKQPELTKLNFLYYDVPKWASWWKKSGRGVHLYYFLWQWGAYFYAKKLHQTTRFELVHHVTFVSVRQPSFMGNLGIPFVFGPIAGGESVPWDLRKSFRLRGWLADAVRDIANLFVRFDPLMRMSFSQAWKIYATSEQTRNLIPQQYKKKTRVQLAIATERLNEFTPGNSVPASKDGKPLRLIFVGNFLYLKGMQMGIEAFSLLLKRHPHVRLTMVGRGPEDSSWRDKAKYLGIKNQIDWLPWMSQNELLNVYREHDIMLFPSLRDSGGMVVLEAMSHGLPVVCFNLGGPGVLVDNTCGRAVDVTKDDVDTATEKLAAALIELASTPELRATLSEGARRKAEKSTWDATVASIYDVVEQGLIKGSHPSHNFFEQVST